MKKKCLFSFVFLFFFLILARGGWFQIDVRLDTGDAPGVHDSFAAQISSSGSNNYVVWADDRNGESDIYFNSSTNDGMIWQVSDIRLNIGDTPGASKAMHPQISSNGNNVYVVWYDARNGNSDIYFNYSTDSGVTWQANDIRLDRGDSPGVSNSWSPKISSSDNNVYVVWEDQRNGWGDIYFNYSTDGGVSWLVTDLRLNTGDIPGASGAWHPEISSNGSDVYVVWSDDRNGSFDIYFNYSEDGGATWQTNDIRLDTGDPLGANSSNSAQISSSGGNVYVVWRDRRNDSNDLYFNYSADGGATWQASDIRIDTASNSFYPEISSSSNNVYAVWCDDRNGNLDLYFNYSADGGATWQASDIRIDTGDLPGVNNSLYPEISSSSNNVYVVWCDDRNGRGDIYFNYSINGGLAWQTPDVRIDTGDSPGASHSMYPEISCLENNVYVVWWDLRNGKGDIYFNTNSAVDPVPDIKANGSDGPITINRSDTLAITVEFDKGSFAGFEADWWLVAMTPLGWYHYDRDLGWLPGREVTLQIPLRDLQTREVLNMSGLPAGEYTFYFGIDLVKNGKINLGQAYYDTVEVTITP
jgi:hypothetical protein